MNEIMHVPAGERIAVYGREASGRSRTLRLEQKSVVYTKDVGKEASKHDHVVVDPSAGNFGTLKSCSTLPGHLSFIGCEMDEKCYKLSYLSVLQTFSRRILDVVMGLTGLKEFVETAKVFLKAMDDIAARRREMALESLLVGP